MNFDTAISQIEIVQDGGDEWAAEAISVLHGAFVQYADQGEPSGAMVETVESLSAELNTGTKLAVALVDGQAAAMVKYREMDDQTLYFSRLAVSPAARGRGLASTLVAMLRESAKNIGLTGLSCTVRSAETRNIAIYEHLGMEIVGREERRSLTGLVLPVVLMRDVAGKEHSR